MRRYFADLVPVNDPEYRRWCKKNARTSRATQSQLRQTDKLQQNYQSLLQKEYDLWENSLRKIFGSIVNEHPNRILKFNSETGTNSFRELDFVAETGQTFLFCEIKLQQRYQDKKQQNKIKSAWRQVNKSVGIARRNYSSVLALVVMVDMSFVFNIEQQKLDNFPSFESVKNVQLIFNNLEKYVSKEIAYKNNPPIFVWFDSREVYEEARNRNVLNQEDLIRFRSIYHEFEQDGSRGSIRYSSCENRELNNPFSVLLKNK